MTGHEFVIQDIVQTMNDHFPFKNLRVVYDNKNFSYRVIMDPETFVQHFNFDRFVASSDIYLLSFNGYMCHSKLNIKLQRTKGPYHPHLSVMVDGSEELVKQCEAIFIKGDEFRALLENLEIYRVEIYRTNPMGKKKEYFKLDKPRSLQDHCEIRIRHSKPKGLFLLPLSLQTNLEFLYPEASTIIYRCLCNHLHCEDCQKGICTVIRIKSRK